MKKILITLMLFATFIVGKSQSFPDFEWGEGIPSPDLSWTGEVGSQLFPEGDKFSAFDYGLKNDTMQLSTSAIQRAIDACSKAGGGIVEIPAGKYRIGAIYLKSNVNLHLHEGAVLIASENIADYPEIRTRIAGIEMVWPSAVVNILDAENVALTGKGIIDGRGKVWWNKYWNMRKDYEKKKLRWIVDYDCKRVRGILVSNSKQVTLKNFILMRTGFWGCQILYSDKCTIDGITINNNIEGHGPSTDGIDIDSSTNILVENCEIDCNDDNICIKAGRDADGLRVNRPTMNVIVRNCVTHKGAGLITCGSETSGGIRNVLGYDLKASGTSSVCRLKSAMNRGGIVENIYMTRIKADSTRGILVADLNWNPSYSYSKLPEEYEEKEIPEHWKVMLTPVTPEEKGYPHFRNVYLSDIEGTDVGTFISASGWNDALRLENFYLTGIKAEVKKAGKIAYTSGFNIGNVRLKVADGGKIELRDNEDISIDIKYIPEQ